MGNKTNPLSLRIQSEIRFFESHWYSDLYYQSLFHRELVIRQYLTSLFKQIGACAIGTRQAQIQISIQNFPKRSNVVFFYPQPKGLMKFLQECFVKKRGEKILKRILRYSRKRRRLIRKKLRTGSICIKASALSTCSATLMNGDLLKKTKLFDRKQKNGLFINDSFDPKKPENLKSLQSLFGEKRGASFTLFSFARTAKQSPAPLRQRRAETSVSLSSPVKRRHLRSNRTVRLRRTTTTDQRKQRNKADWPSCFAQPSIRSYVENKVSRKEERSYVHTLNPLKKEWRRQLLKLPVNEQLKHVDVERNFVKIFKKKTFKNLVPFAFFKRFVAWLKKQTIRKTLTKKKKGFMTDKNSLYFHTKLSKTAAQSPGFAPCLSAGRSNRSAKQKDICFLRSNRKGKDKCLRQTSSFCNSREFAQMISSKKLATLQSLLMKKKWVTALPFLQLQQVAKSKKGGHLPVYSNFALNGNSCIAYSEKKKNRKIKRPSLRKKELPSYSSSIALSEPFQTKNYLTKKEMSGFAVASSASQEADKADKADGAEEATAKPFFTVLEKKEKLEASKKKVVMLLLLFRSVKKKQSQNPFFSSAFMKKYPRSGKKEQLSLSMTDSKCKIDLTSTLLKSIFKKKNKKFLFEKVTVLRFFLITALFSNLKNETLPLPRLFQRITRFARFKLIKK